MSLVLKLREKVKDAMRQGDVVTRDILRVVIGETETLDGKQGSKPVTDEQVSKIIGKLILSNLETLKYQTGPRKEVLEKENIVLESYLAKSATTEEIMAALLEIKDELKSSPNTGKAIGASMAFLKSRNITANGNDVKAVVEEIRQ